MNKVRFNKWQLATMGALVGIGLFNPMTVEVLDEWFKLAYTVVFLVCSAWVAVYILMTVLKPEPINIPPKTKATKKQVYAKT